MILHQPASIWPGRHHGPFRIRRMRPGTGLGPDNSDTGLGPLGTVDRASLSPGLTVPMHEHRDDEILSYLRQGVMRHRDSSGVDQILSPSHTMLMNAGRGFSHEEEVPATTVGTTEMLQIFVRPERADLPPKLQFHHFAEASQPQDSWRLIAGPDGSQAPLHLRNRVWVYDRAILAGAETSLPALGTDCGWCHIFSGSGRLGSQSMSAGDSAIIQDEEMCYRALEGSQLVFFRVDLAAAFSRDGSLSG
jgi:quercetin 2,3-dioxygenase